MGDIVAERLGDQLVGGGEVLLAVPEQHEGPLVEGGAGGLRHQGGLAQARFAGDQEDFAPARRSRPV